MEEDSVADVDQIVKALIEVRSKCGAVKKSGWNDFHNYHYATEADIAAQIGPLMDEAGLVLIPSLASEQEGFKSPYTVGDITHAVLKYTLAHTSGQVWPEPLYVAAQGQDKGDKGCWKMSTGAFKYCLLRLLMVATGDDPENDGGGKAKGGKAKGGKAKAKAPQAKGPITKEVVEECECKANERASEFTGVSGSDIINTLTKDIKAVPQEQLTAFLAAIAMWEPPGSGA